MMKWIQLESSGGRKKGLVLVTIDGALRLTQAGQVLYAPLLAKYGFSLATVKTTTRFREFMIHVNAGRLEANAAELERLLNDPATPKDACALIVRALAAELSEGAAVFNAPPGEVKSPPDCPVAGVPMS